MTRTQLESLIAAKLPNNSTGQISAADARAVLLALTAGLFSLESDKVEVSNLSTAVQALIQGGLDPTKYQGTWVPSTNTPTIAVAGVGNTGQWYIASAAGTATGNAAGTYGQGDKIQSNGTVWLKQPAPPMSISPGSVAFDSLASTLQALVFPQFSEEYVYAITDAQGRIALGIKPTGEVFAKVDPQDGAVTTPKLAALAVTRAKLADEVGQLIGAAMDEGTGYSWALVDSAGRIGLGVRLDGSVTGKISLPSASVLRSQLASEISDLIPQTMDPSTGYHYAILDASGRIALGITEQGYVYGRFTLGLNAVNEAAIQAGSVSETKLSADIARAAIPHGGGRVEVEDDSGWRGRTFQVAARTDPSGSAFTEFSPARVRSIRGVNNTGTTLEFRYSPGLVIRGRKYRGTWDAATGSPDSAPLAGDWWNVTSPGTFGGVAYIAGDRLLALDTVVAQGAQYTKGIAGELWYLGEFTPSSHSPSNIRDGDVWQASTSGTFSSIAFAAGDLLLRISGAWGKYASAAITTVTNGSAFCFSVSNSREIEVRRADKSTTRVGILADALRTMKSDKSTDAVVMWGDSMVATGGLNTAISGLLAPRSFLGISYPGASSEQILAMARKEARGADAHRGKFHAIFAGTNNATDLAQTRECALQFADLAGARDNRMVFLSVIGQSQCGWNGTRIVMTQFEDSFSKSGVAYELEEWYKVAFPGAFLNSRAELLARATSTPALLFPGLTEAQAASTYGALPLSFWLDYSLKPWTPGALTFTGYHSTAGVPAGGADGDYKIRTANGTIGALEVRWAGVWTEHVWDITHMNPTGNAALAAAFVAFLNANQI